MVISTRAKKVRIFGKNLNFLFIHVLKWCFCDLLSEKYECTVCILAKCIFWSFFSSIFEKMPRTGSVSHTHIFTCHYPYRSHKRKSQNSIKIKTSRRQGRDALPKMQQQSKRKIIKTVSLSFEFWGLFLTIIDLTFMSLLSHYIKPQRRHFDFAGTLLEDRIWHFTQLFLYFLLHQNSFGKNKRILGILAWGIQEGDSMICNYPARSRIYKIKIFLFLCNNG